MRRASVLLLLFKHACDFSFAWGCCLGLLGKDQEPCPVSQGLTPETWTLRWVARATWWRTKVFFSRSAQVLAGTIKGMKGSPTTLPNNISSCESGLGCGASSTRETRWDVFSPGQFYRSTGVCGSHFTKSKRGPRETNSQSKSEKRLNLYHPWASHPSKPWQKNQVSPFTGMDNPEETIQVMMRFFFLLNISEQI